MCLRLEELEGHPEEEDHQEQQLEVAGDRRGEVVDRRRRLA